MTEADTTALEQRLAAMTDSELRDFWDSLEVEDPQMDVVAGALERRNVDF